MVMSVIPTRCVICARWLGRGRSRTNDCAGLTPDMVATDRQKSTPLKAPRIMGERLLLACFRQNAEFGIALDPGPRVRWLVAQLRRVPAASVSESANQVASCSLFHWLLTQNCFWSPIWGICVFFWNLAPLPPVSKLEW